MYADKTNKTTRDPPLDDISDIQTNNTMPISKQDIRFSQSCKWEFIPDRQRQLHPHLYFDEHH